MPKIFAVSDKKLRQKTLAGKNGAQVFFSVRKMSTEEEKKPEKSAREKKRIVPAALGFLAVAAHYGHHPAAVGREFFKLFVEREFVYLAGLGQF